MFFIQDVLLNVGATGRSPLRVWLIASLYFVIPNECEESYFIIVEDFSDSLEMTIRRMAGSCPSDQSNPCLEGLAEFRGELRDRSLSLFIKAVQHALEPAGGEGLNRFDLVQL